MDTTEVAQYLNTSPRVLRQFLRSPMSTYVAVGSGARYDFTIKDMPTLEKRFNEWQGAGKPKPTRDTPPKAVKRTPAADAVQRAKDAEIWEQEARERAALKKPITVEQQMSADIRDPRIRRRILADAAAAEARLNLRLLAAGLHITQLGDRRSA